MGVVVVAVAAGVLWFGSPAWAAFPGANGLLAVQPRSGAGIVLVAANGQGKRWICGRRGQCGSAAKPAVAGLAVRPRWSPDGRALVFAGPRIRIVYPDGSCMNCQFGAASNPAFAPSGTVISFIGRGHVTVDGIDGLRESSPPPGAAVDAVWSASGGLAVVRGGVVWAGRPGLLRRIGAGVQPSWSPDGRLIAAVRRGWVVVMRVGDRRVRRVVRGSAPAFSPDGRWIAFVAGDHRLMIIPAQGRHPAPRPVGKIRAVSVDWQPLPGGANPGCAPPPGSKILASSLDAVLTRRASAPASYGPASAVMGCLRADGRERLLERIPRGNVDYASSIGSGVLAAPYAGLAVDWQDEHYGGFGANVQVFDLRTGLLQNKLGGESISCDYDNCPPVSLDHLALGSDGVSAAHFQTLEPAGSLSTPLEQVSCAAASTVCVAVDVIGSGVLTTSNPTGGPTAWTSATLDSGPHAMTCPSPSLCVGHNWGSIFTSTDPTGGANAWKSTALPTTVVNLDCPSTTLCVASGNSGVFVDNNGRVAVSTDPSGGAGAWSISTIAGANFLGPDLLLDAASVLHQRGRARVDEGVHVNRSNRRHECVDGEPRYLLVRVGGVPDHDRLHRSRPGRDSDHDRSEHRNVEAHTHHRRAH